MLPAVLLNIGGVLAFALYYALRSVHPDLVASVSSTEVSLSLYAMVVVVEWSLAIAVMAGLHRSGRPLRSLLAPGGSLLGSRLAPAVLVFLGLNLLFGVYVATYQLFFGGWPKLTGAPPWERLALLAILPRRYYEAVRLGRGTVRFSSTDGAADQQERGTRVASRAIHIAFIQVAEPEGMGTRTPLGSGGG